MKVVEARFVIPTDYIGVEFDEDFEYEFDDDTDDEDVIDYIQNEFDYWLDEMLSDFRAYASWEKTGEAHYE